MTLEKHIRDIQKKLKTNPKEKYPNEQSISQGIVLHLLRALQWPDDDTEVVVPEYKVSKNRVDFALCVNKKPVIFIEVKRLGNTLGAEKQLLNYACDEGVRFGIMTDGQEWHFYLPMLAEVRSGERRVYTLDLQERSARESSNRLLRYLSYKEVRSGEALKNAEDDYANVPKEREAEQNIPVAWAKLIEERDKELVNIVSEKVESISGFTPNPGKIIAYLSKLNEHSTRPTPDTPEKEPKYPSGKAPNKKLKVTFPDGTVIEGTPAAGVFADTIRKIGARKARRVGLTHHKNPLISDQKFGDPKRQGHWYDVGQGLYVNTHSGTPTKHKFLSDINDGLKLGLKIELFD